MNQKHFILSDSNINTLNIDSTNSQKSNRDKQTSQVSSMFSKSILQEGFTVINDSPTHSTSTIDHIFTTHPLQLTNITTTETHLSDHRMVTANRMTKEPSRKPRYTSTRAYNKIDYFEMSNSINQDPRLYEVMQSNDTNWIASTIIQVIRDHLDSRAPKRRIQVTKTKTNPSEKTMSNHS